MARWQQWAAIRVIGGVVLLAALVLAAGVSAPTGEAQLPGQLTVNPGGPYNGQAGVPIAFSAQVGLGGRPPGTQVQVEWLFGDGGSGSGAFIRHAYSAPGTYTVTVTASVGPGQVASATTTAAVAGAAPPPPLIGQLTVSAGGPYSGLAGQPITFQAQVGLGGRPPGTQVQIEWSFGDGSGAAGQVVNHAYNAPGTYTVTVSALVGAGQSAVASTTATISGIVPPPLPPPPPPPPPVSGPFQRSDAAMVYDGASRQLVLFGGCCAASGESLGDMWLWDGATWNSPGPLFPSPPARAGAAAAFHGGLGVVVLFGGVSCAGGVCTDLNDTWTWNGSEWAQQSPATSPSPRSNAGMAYDAATGLIVLFGGKTTSGQTFGDTWVWDGSNWGVR